MSLNNRPTPETSGQSTGCDPKTSRRNSGLFAFFKWFKPSTSRESIDTDLQISQSSSCDSLSSTQSAGTVASFSYVPPSAYKKCVSEKCIVLGPETDTYKARLKQRDKRRENDKNLTLRKKYNLFFNKDTLLKPKAVDEDENTKSLPLMTRSPIETEDEIKMHRRTFSESSKVKKAGSYVHVKGKRKAPQPPPNKDGTATSSLRRKKRLAPIPPSFSAEKVMHVIENSLYAETDIICNDSLKLDHGILKSAKDSDKNIFEDKNSAGSTSSATGSSRSNDTEIPVSPRPWYKRNINRDSIANKREKVDQKYEPIERLPELSFKRNSSLDLTLEEARIDKKKEEKRKSGLSFLTNISELDREASEIIKNREYDKNGLGDVNATEIPEFMRPKEAKINTDGWVSPKRRTAKDLIAKFNAITNVTKVTVFGASQRDAKLFGKQTSLDETKRKQEFLLESHKKRIEEIDKKNAPLMKSESASAIKTKSETPKTDRKSWKCPKCNVDNEYWRIICHVCSAIKPYFDDFSSNKAETRTESKTASPLVTKKEKTPPKKSDLNLERSKTQIGFSALSNYNANTRTKVGESIIMVGEKQRTQADHKKEEKEKLKKMLIEMKNSLPKRKSNLIAKQNNRASVIVENNEQTEQHEPEPMNQVHENPPTNEGPILDKPEKTQGEKVAEILIGTTTTIYENIKVRKTDNPKPIKVSSSVQTSGVMKQVVVPPSTIANLIRDQSRYTYELMRPKDFEDIYYDTNAKSASRVYANLARNDELSVFFNMPKNIDNGRNNIQPKGANYADTIEINRLLKRLETSIAKGELTEAAIFAKELAQLKVNCSVIRQKPSKSDFKKNGIQIEMYVEDKLSHRGPFPIIVTPEQTVAQLKKQVEVDFEIPADYQRWILGKTLVTDDNATLQHHNIITEGCPVFLYLVATETKKKSDQAKHPDNDNDNLPSTSRNLLPVEERGPVLNETKSNFEKQPENKIEKMKTNVQNLQNLLSANKEEKKIPKIVDVIPKMPENKSKTEISIITTQIEKADVKTEIRNANNLKIPDPKIEIKSNNTSSYIGQEVKPKIQYVFPTIQNCQENNPKEAVTSKSISDVPQVKIMEPKQTLQEKSSITIQGVKTESKEEILNSEKCKVAEPTTSHEPPKADEEDFEDYDAKTLKPAKEWECHLCTLLNPIASNVCAVCATVRLMKSKVQPTKKHLKKKAPRPKTGAAVKNDETYLQLINLDNEDLVKNVEPFECLVCFLEIPPQYGVTLRECLHQFCEPCLSQTIEFADEAEIKCPYRDEDYSCNIALQDREIKALVSLEVYEQHLAKSVAQAENKIDKSFHCKTPDCKGWCIFEDNVNEFRCPVCRKTNCLTCQAIHFGLNCKQYQEKMKDESEIDDDARRTKNMLEEMVNKGEAIECPTCKIILMKKWGCDWLRCSMCKTEICWVTRGPRWGPTGKGDTSGGCQCGVNGIKCHPKCNYCH